MHGLIAWFTRNPVAANLLMVLILIGGWFSVQTRLPLEVFPEFELDQVNVSIALPGASPEEAEKGLAIRIEEAISDLEGIKQLSSVSREGAARVSAEIYPSYDTRDLMADIKSRVDAISTFPGDAERPVVSLTQRQRETISLAIYGALEDWQLRQLAEQVRDELQQLPQITQVELDGVADYEISIEVDEATLREYGLQMDQLAVQLQQGSLELSAGSLRTREGEIMLRTKGQAYTGEDFAQLLVVSDQGGSRVRLGDIATIKDGFEEDPINTRFNGEPAILLEVYRVGQQSAIEVANAVKDYIAVKEGALPQGIELAYWRDRSKIVKARLNTLKNSAIQGCLLVILLLALFLRPAVALWVCLGIPLSFMGGLILMPQLGVTLNIISLFAFIMVLGIVVDDAIVTGENVYSRLNRGEPPLEAAIRGTQEVAVPVTFGVLTTIAAFIPLMMIEGVRGKIFSQIPLVVIPVLLFSLVESKLILPAHLRHVRINPQPGRLARIQQGIANGLERFISKVYRPSLDFCLHRRYLTLSMALAILLIVTTLATSGWVRFVFFPRIPSETARASLVMPAGTSFELTDDYVQRILHAAQQLQQRHQDPDTGESVILNILATTGSGGGSGSAETHRGRVVFEIEPPETRANPITSQQLVQQWRELIGPLPGVESLSFRAEIGRGGSPLDVQLASNDFAAMARFAKQVKLKLAEFPAVFDIEDSLSKGKRELQLTLTPMGEALGLSLSSLTSQVRSAFYGYQVQRIQRGREDLRVYLRYPAEQRRSLANLNSLLIRTSEGGDVPFSQVAALVPSQSPLTINRLDRQRTQNIRADLDKQSANIESIKQELVTWLGQQQQAFPQVSFSLEGEAKEQRESFGSLQLGLIFVLFVVYSLLAIPFRSYWQPLIVMSVIPFGCIGAILGHMLMGMSLSIMSMMGMLALVGVVVNDSLVLVDYVNRQRAQGIPLQQAVSQAGSARFRAVMLTSLTTFAGLMPLIFEKSTQAQFLIPMAVSLGFGILFATLITLLLVPVNYLLLEDAKGLFAKLKPA
ncbi:efflux RND transporter permease subunit [Aliagarivorans taiwanensis]|uniref:efflux RND transporter permease subunit n=1 Tax=Aliagarivorans taiwanensis TaxID=561966 RepID=UPI0004101E39|nr:efflux RND transporter permease subunit [Aliagarivorans taiwanensis]